MARSEMEEEESRVVAASSGLGADGADSSREGHAGLGFCRMTGSFPLGLEQGA